MIIPINDQYRIKGDKYQYKVQKHLKKKNDPEEWEWQSIQWFTTLESAIQWLTEMRWRTAETYTLADALAEKERLIAELTQALSPMFEVKTR